LKGKATLWSLKEESKSSLAVGVGVKTSAFSGKFNMPGLTDAGEKWLS